MCCTIGNRSAREFIMKNYEIFRKNTVIRVSETVDPYIRIGLNCIIITPKQDDNVQYLRESCMEQVFTMCKGIDRGKRDRSTKLTVHHKNNTTELLHASELSDLISTYYYLEIDNMMRL